MNSWRINANATNRTLRSAWWISTGILVFSIRSIISNQLNYSYALSLLTAIAYLSVTAAICWAHLRSKKTDRFIHFESDILWIPRAILKQQCLRLVEIKSVERLKNFNGVMAVIIGRYEKLSIILERSNFTSPAEFDDFLHFLEYAIANNRSARSSNEIRAVDAKSSVSTSLPLAILSLLMLGVYVLYTDASYENITTAAIELGGLDKKMLQTGELYRFASSFFLHYTPYHLGLNVISLAVIGRYVDVIAGRVRFVNILLISAVSGSLLSLAFSHFDAVVGASGGILGLFGAYLSIVARFHNQLPGSVSAPRRNILLVLALQFLCDFVLPGVDVFSHIGGFLAGFLYARITLNKCTVGSTALATRIEFTLAATISSAFIYGLFYFFTIAFGFHLHYS